MALVCSALSLGAGLLLGAVFLPSREGKVPSREAAVAVAESKTSEHPGALSSADPNAPQLQPSLPAPGSPISAASGAPANPVNPQATTAAGTLAASRVGMPANLPDQFLGIRFGTDLTQVSGIAQWKETAGKRHRKAELLGSEVEAVLTTDAQNRLIMGSYVRVAARQPEALTPFLEWAVNVQDAVSALYGEPIRVHSVEGATDAVEVVRKISAGEDFYQATWEREAEEGMIDLSIRVFNERSVVFRMEYRARQLYSGFVESQSAKEGVKDAAKDSVNKDLLKDGSPAAAPAIKEE